MEHGSQSSRPVWKCVEASINIASCYFSTSELLDFSQPGGLYISKKVTCIGTYHSQIILLTAGSV